MKGGFRERVHENPAALPGKSGEKKDRRKCVLRSRCLQETPDILVDDIGHLVVIVAMLEDFLIFHRKPDFGAVPRFSHLRDETI